VSWETSCLMQSPTFLPCLKCGISNRFMMPKLYNPIIHCARSIMGLPMGPISPVFHKYDSLSKYGNLVVSHTLWSKYLNLGTFPNISSTMITTFGRYGSVISMASCTFLFYAIVDGLASVMFASSSSLSDSDRSVISSTNTSSPSWVYHSTIFSSDFVVISGLGFRIQFRAPEICNISPCCVFDVSSSTRVRLIDSVSEVVTYSNSTTFSGCLILSLCL
jgi:hypothetical protein